jgi:hypothetical protein
MEPDFTRNQKSLFKFKFLHEFDSIPDFEIISKELKEKSLIYQIQ